jgi:hypothetical protein
MPWPKSQHGSTGQGHGGPAKGKGHGGPARGVHPVGWGGPARGGPNRPAIKAGDGIQAMSNDPDIRARNLARVEELKDHLFGLAKGAEREETQLAAAVAFMNRVEGMPVARQVVANVADPSQLTDADLAAIALSGRRDADAAPADQGQPPRVVN